MSSTRYWFLDVRVGSLKYRCTFPRVSTHCVGIPRNRTSSLNDRLAPPLPPRFSHFQRMASVIKVIQPLFHGAAPPTDYVLTWRYHVKFAHGLAADDAAELKVR
jgi:hypothetical protein